LALSAKKKDKNRQLFLHHSTSLEFEFFRVQLKFAFRITVVKFEVHLDHQSAVAVTLPGTIKGIFLEVRFVVHKSK